MRRLILLLLLTACATTKPVLLHVEEGADTDPLPPEPVQPPDPEVYLFKMLIVPFNKEEVIEAEKYADEVCRYMNQNRLRHLDPEIDREEIERLSHKFDARLIREDGVFMLRFFCHAK
jgi:hypothetical protein